MCTEEQEREVCNSLDIELCDLFRLRLTIVLESLTLQISQELVFSDSGRHSYDRFGRTVKISGDGRTMAVGAYTASSGAFVRLYTMSGTSWSSLQQLNGNGGFGFSVDLSHDGSTLAAVATNGAFYVYELPNNSSSYELLYSTGFSGAWEIAVSSDGNTIGVTSTNDKAAMYQRNGDSFQQKGSDILGYGRNGDISLNSDGSIVVVGDPNGYSGAGRAGVFQWINDGESMKWVQMGSDIIGVGGSFGYFGAVSMTYDGMTVSVGSLYYDNSKGLVRVYHYDGAGNIWNKKGGDLIGDNSGQRFSKSALSSDGTYLLVGAGTGNYFQMFQWDGTNYETFGEKVYGEGGNFGGNVDMSADGSTVVIGAYFHDGKGKIYMYLTSVPALAPIEAPSFTPSAPPSLRPTNHLETLSYFITYDSSEVRFEGNANNSEIVLYYNVSSDKDEDYINVMVMSGDECNTDQSAQKDIKVSYEVLFNNSQNGITPVKAVIDVDTAKIMNNQVFYKEIDGPNGKEATIAFCIRSDIGEFTFIDENSQSHATSISFSVVKVKVTIQLEIGFESARVSIQEDVVGEATESAEIITSLDACTCDLETLGCITTTTYSQNDILNVCITTPTTAAIVTQFQDVVLSQDGIEAVVVDSDGKPSLLTSISSLRESTAVVSTRIISVFFENESPVNMSGTAIISFAESRKLISVGAEEFRMTQESDLGNEGSRTSSFEITVNLSKEDEDVSPTRSPFTFNTNMMSVLTFFISASTLI